MRQIPAERKSLASESPTTDEARFGVLAASRTMSLFVLNDSWDFTISRPPRVHQQPLVPPPQVLVILRKVHHPAFLTSKLDPEKARSVPTIPSRSVIDCQVEPRKSPQRWRTTSRSGCCMRADQWTASSRSIPKLCLTVSTVLITLGGILFLPGVSARIGSMIFAPHAVKTAEVISHRPQMAQGRIGFCGGQGCSTSTAKRPGGCRRCQWWSNERAAASALR